MTDQNKDLEENLIEEAIGILFRAFYKLRKSNQVQREYDTMGTIVDMLSQERQHIRKTYNIEI